MAGDTVSVEPGGNEPIEVLFDPPGWSTTITVFCECDEMIDGPDIVLRDCPHKNGTKIEHCPKCNTVLGVASIGLRAGDTIPDCSCWR